jgi:YVTN family beta-propeller protein
VIDVAKNAVVATLKLDRPFPKPKGVVVHPSGQWAYVANGGSNDVAVIDVSALQVAAFIPVGTRPWGLGITRDGKKLYVANGVSESVSVIDTASQKVVATIPVGKGPWGIAVGR